MQQDCQNIYGNKLHMTNEPKSPWLQRCFIYHKRLIYFKCSQSATYIRRFFLIHEEFGKYSCYYKQSPSPHMNERKNERMKEQTNTIYVSYPTHIWFATYITHLCSTSTCHLITAIKLGEACFTSMTNSDLGFCHLLFTTNIDSCRLYPLKGPFINCLF